MPCVTTDTLRDVGVTTLTAVDDFFGTSSPNRIVIDNTDTKLSGGWNSISSTDIVFHGKDCVVPQKRGSRITYKAKDISAGSYKVYILHPGPVDNDTEANTWLYLQYYQQKKSGKLSLKLNVDNMRLTSGKARLYDAILLVRDN